MKVDTLEHRKDVKQQIKDIIKDEYQGFKVGPAFIDTLLKEIINDSWKEFIDERRSV